MNQRQKNFVAEYLVSGNATEAAKRAGYSPKTSGSQGERLLKNAEVAAELARKQAVLGQRIDVTAERVIGEIANMAFYDIGDLAPKPDGKGGFAFKGVKCEADLHKLPEAVRRAILGFSWDRSGNFTLKLADKSKALDQLARHLALYNDRLDVNVTDGLAERVRRAKQRVSG